MYTYGTGANANYSGRVLVYPDQVPFDTDILRAQQYKMVDVSMLAQTILGLPLTVGGSFVGLSSGLCTQEASPDMTVLIGTCALYSLQEMEPIAYGNLGPLTTPLIYKQFINMLAFSSSTLGTITAPGTVGQSQYYLIQGTPQTVPVNSVNRPYYNPSNPASPIFNSAYDTEIDNIVFSLVAGTPGVSPSIPSPTGSAIGMFVILVTYGQTSIVNADISGYPGSFIGETLVDKISQATADGRYVQKSAIQTPQTTVYTSGTGTYTTPTGALYLEIEMVAGGGGGSGSGSTQTSGTNGGNTTFGTAFLTCHGGSGAVGNTPFDGGAGGAATGGDINISGSYGQAGAPGANSPAVSAGSMGGVSMLGGQGAGGSETDGTPNPTPANSGGGGCGGAPSSTQGCAPAGGAGGGLKKIITSPAASYSYAVGAAGVGGAAGGSGNAGGNAAAGIIRIVAKFQ